MKSFLPASALSVAIGFVAVLSAASAQGDSEIASRRALYQHVYCAVRYDLSSAKRLFTAPPGSTEEAKLIRRLNVQVCGLFGNGLPALEADRQLVRGVVAEAVYDQVRKKKNPADPAMIPFGNLSADEIAALDARGQASLAGLDFAQCVVAASPQDARALINSSSLSGEQEKVLQRLQPYFAPCLLNGAQFTFSKLMLRGLIAEATYRSLYFNTAAGKN